MAPCHLALRKSTDSTFHDQKEGFEWARHCGDWSLRHCGCCLNTFIIPHIILRLDRTSDSEPSQ